MSRQLIIGAPHKQSVSYQCQVSEGSDVASFVGSCVGKSLGTRLGSGGDICRYPPQYTTSLTSPRAHTHTDQLTAVSIKLPDQSVNGSIPAGISLLYSSTVTTRYGTNTSSGLRYRWDFGDHDGFTSDKAIVEHVYSHAGTYTVILEVQNNIGSVHNRTTLRVYQGTHPSSHT